MRLKTVLYIFIALIPAFMLSCGVGGSADNGASVILEASLTSEYPQIDLIRKIDNDQNGTCENYTIPTDDFIEITFKSKVPENSKLPPSDVIIESYRIKYIPLKKNLPSFEEELTGNCIIDAGETKRCRFPIFKSFDKYTFYVQGRDDDYRIEIRIHGKEVLYDKSIDLTVSGTVGIGDFQQEGEPNCTFEEK